MTGTIVNLMPVPAHGITNSRPFTLDDPLIEVEHSWIVSKGPSKAIECFLSKGAVRNLA